MSLYSTKSFEAANKMVRKYVQYKMPSETYSQAIFRRSKQYYRILFLLLGGGWDSNNQICIDPQQMVYKLPESYLDEILLQNERLNTFKWFSKLLEIKYHPQNPQLIGRQGTVHSYIGEINIDFIHRFQLGDHVLSSFKPHDGFLKMYKEKAECVSTIRSAKKIVWCNSGRKLESHVGKCVSYSGARNVVKVLMIGTISEYRLKQMNSSIISVCGLSIKFHNPSSTKPWQYGIITSKVVVIKPSQLIAPLSTHHNCAKYGKYICMGKIHDWRKSREIILSGYVNNGIHMSWDPIRELYSNVYDEYCIYCIIHNGLLF
eukprot:534996_1